VVFSDIVAVTFGPGPPFHTILPPRTPPVPLGLIAPEEHLARLDCKSNPLRPVYYVSVIDQLVENGARPAGKPQCRCLLRIREAIPLLKIFTKNLIILLLLIF
jgi:hypothetical protein